MDMLSFLCPEKMKTHVGNIFIKVVCLEEIHAHLHKYKYISNCTFINHVIFINLVMCVVRATNYVIAMLKLYSLLFICFS